MPARWPAGPPAAGPSAGPGRVSGVSSDIAGRAGVNISSTFWARSVGLSTGAVSTGATPTGAAPAGGRFCVCRCFRNGFDRRLGPRGFNRRCSDRSDPAGAPGFHRLNMPGRAGIDEHLRLWFGPAGICIGCRTRDFSLGWHFPDGCCIDRFERRNGSGHRVFGDGNLCGLGFGFVRCRSQDPELGRALGHLRRAVDSGCKDRYPDLALKSRIEGRAEDDAGGRVHFVAYPVGRLVDLVQGQIGGLRIC